MLSVYTGGFEDMEDCLPSVAKSKIYYFLLISLDRIPRIIIITI
jgi:hypothetical protein